MAEFPPNLDDGELWLPSDIFLNEVPAKYNPYRISCMEDLAGHFAALFLLQNHSSSTHLRPHPKPPLNSQRLKLAVRGISASQLPPGFLDFNGGAAELGQGIYGCANGPFLARSEPFYKLRNPSPQVDSYLETRPRVLQRQQNPIQNRVYPFQTSGFGFCGSGAVRESSGTGVFHPRILNSTESPAGVDFRRKQGGRSRQQEEYYQVTQQRNSTRKIGVINKHEDCYYHLPPEMGLPQDWTY